MIAMPIIQIKYISIIVVFGLLLSGCGSSIFSQRIDNPNIQDITVAPHIKLWNKTGLNTFATTASRRLVIAKMDDYGDTLEVCGEAPPDVGEAVASAVADALKIAITEPKTGISNEVVNNYARTVATQITPLIYRTQGLQFYRDAMYSLCLDRMNSGSTQKMIDPITSKIKIPLTTTKITTTSTFDKVTGKSITETTQNTTIESYQEFDINTNNYMAMKAFITVQALEMIKKELPIMLQAQQNFFQNAKIGMSIEDLNKLANSVKEQGITSSSKQKSE